MNDFLQSVLGVDSNTISSMNPLTGLTQLQETIQHIFIIIVVAMVVAAIFALIMVVLRVQSQRATIAMQKDLSAIRALLENQATPTPSQPTDESLPE